jgi:predicted CopG family antitoxin
LNADFLPKARVKGAYGALARSLFFWYHRAMTVSEIVEKLFVFNHDKPINIRIIRKFLTDNKINVSDESIMKIMDVYNRRLIDLHMKEGEDKFPDDHRTYIDARKELDLTIASVSKKLTTEEIIEFKKKINDLINAVIIWSKK